MSTQALPSATPVIISIPRAAFQLSFVVLFALVIYYFVGVDEGLVSVFGNSMGVHEFVHDARHFLGFPCH